MTKEEIIKRKVESEHPWIHYDDVLVCMQHYANQETESLRQQNAKLVEALKAAEQLLVLEGYTTSSTIIKQINRSLQP